MATRRRVLLAVNEETKLAGAREVEGALREALATHGLEEDVHIVDTGDLGVVGRGVVMRIQPDDVLYGGVTVADAVDIVREHLVGGRPVERLRVHAAVGAGVGGVQTRIVLWNCGIIDPESLEEAIAAGAYAALAKVVEERISRREVIETITESGLRGRGGAGFPTGRKWSLTAEREPKYVICNADEGEPGTFKDRLILEGDPHRLIEGMILAGYAIGAEKGYIYIRGEYGLSIDRMQKAIDDARAAGLLGDRILETDIAFDLEIRKGAGAYVCGEETAMIESIEGKRGYPRRKPPYPGGVGLWGQPTVVNNVETLANVPSILLLGTEWYKSYGTSTCPGTKVFIVLGHVTYPGLIEVAMGTRLRTIIDEHAGGVRNGGRFKGALLGGAAGAFIDESGLDVEMDFDSLQEYAAVLGSGSILVLEEETSIPDLLHGILRFFRHESCGQCAPCRAGTRALLAVSERLRAGRGLPTDLDLMVDVAETMQARSLCPLGQSVILPVTSALRTFRSEFEALLPAAA
jgi:NADH-quinone oxidoreductase subunit F